MTESQRGQVCENCVIGITGPNAGLGAEVTRRFVTRMVVGPGATFAVGSDDYKLLVIKDGVVKSERGTKAGRAVVTGFHYPGDFFELPVPLARDTVMEAVTACEVCEIDLREAERSVPDARSLLKCVVEHAMARIAGDEDRIIQLAHASAAERVVGFLEVLAARPGAVGDDPSVVWTPMRRDDIANYLGMQPETLSRAYAELVRTGVIAVRSRNQVELLRR